VRGESGQAILHLCRRMYQGTTLVVPDSGIERLGFSP
jgi:hypothetical protein